MKKCIVCGSRFGQFYLEALQSIPNIQIEGLLSNGSRRSIECANHYKINLYKDIEDLPSDIDLACVAIKSEVQGGKGNLVAEELLKKGIDVIFEQPLSEKEYASLYKLAKKKNRYFVVSNLYNYLSSVRNFMENYKRIKKEQNVTYINLEFATQLSFPVAQLLTVLLPEIKNIEFKKSEREEGPYQVLISNVNGIQLNLIAHNEVLETSVDNFMRILFRVSIGFDGGELNLLDPHGLVYWRDYIKFPNENLIPHIFKETPPIGMTHRLIDITYHNSELTQQEIFTELWASVISEEIYLYLEKENHNKKFWNTIAQNQINSAVVWKKIMKSLGYPRVSYHDKYEVYDVKKLVRNDEQKMNISQYMGMLENICSKSILYILNEQLNEDVKCINYQSIIKLLNVQNSYKKIIKRWLDYLSKNHYIIGDSRGNYIFECEKIPKTQILKEWEDLESIWPTNIMPISIVKYFKLHFQYMNKILSGDMPANLILFEQGNSKIADDLYKNTAISRYINEQISTYVERISKGKQLTILEVGAGTGATTEEILNKVGNSFKGRYLFTDISKYFLISAQEKFEKFGFMQYEVLDIDSIKINSDIRKEKFDVIIAVGVINNTKNIKRLLSRFNNLLSKSGKLIIGEAYGESSPMLLSQVFMMTEPDDERRNANITFLELEKWYKVFDETGFNVICQKPYLTDELSSFKQALFILEKR